MKNEEATATRWYTVNRFFLFIWKLNIDNIFLENHFQIVDPWGNILAECDKDDGTVPQCKIAQISMDHLKAVRSRMPCQEHRRDDVYALAPIRLIKPEQSLYARCTDFEPLRVQEEATPYFVFEKHPVPESTTFFETPLSIAFTNVTCVVPGRK